MKLHQYKIDCIGNNDSNKSVQDKYVDAIITCAEPLKEGKKFSGYYEVSASPNGAALGMTFFIDVTVKEM